MFLDDDPGDPEYCAKHPDHKKCQPTPVTLTDFWSKPMGCLPLFLALLVLVIWFS